VFSDRLLSLPPGSALKEEAWIGWRAEGGGMVSQTTYQTTCVYHAGGVREGEGGEMQGGKMEEGE